MGGMGGENGHVAVLSTNDDQGDAMEGQSEAMIGPSSVNTTAITPRAARHRLTRSIHSHPRRSLRDGASFQPP
jgi:hypothetical protein